MSKTFEKSEVLISFWLGVFLIIGINRPEICSLSLPILPFRHGAAPDAARTPFPSFNITSVIYFILHYCNLYVNNSAINIEMRDIICYNVVKC